MQLANAAGNAAGPFGKHFVHLISFFLDLRTQQQKAASSHFLEQLEHFTPHQFIHSSYQEEGQRYPSLNY